MPIKPHTKSKINTGVHILRLISIAAALSFTLFAATAHADLTSNVPLDVSRFEVMDMPALVHYAQSGNQHAQFFLAKRLKAQNDSKAAAFWYEQAAKEGVAPAQLNLGIMYLKGDGVPFDIITARAWLEKAAHLGDNRASYTLAILDEKQARLVDAYKWYDLSARDAMLDDKVKSRARGKISELALNLSPTDINRAKNQANSWFQDK